jgi:hypothetical protein
MISRRFIRVSQAAVGANRWQSAWEAGHDVSLEDAIDFALS